MFDFIQKLLYSVLTFQETILKKRLGRKFKSIYSNSSSKRAFGQSVSLQLTSETEKNKEKLQNNIKVILKKYENKPEKLLKFVEKNGTKVYRIPFANKILKLIGNEEGFISEAKGIKGLFLNTVIPLCACEKPNLSIHSKSMFVLRNIPMDSYLMIQQFHKWYAMKLKLPGFDAESQNNFQKFLIPSNDAKIKDLSVDEILGLKEAIARDVEAINFLIDFAKSTAGSKNALKKMMAGGASI